MATLARLTIFLYALRISAVFDISCERRRYLAKILTLIGVDRDSKDLIVVRIDRHY